MTFPPPRYGTPRTPSRRTRGHEVAAVAKACGFQLMDWQRHVIDVALEVDEDGHFVYREVVCLLPRQNGKSLMCLLWELHRAIMFRGPQNIAYTAQTGRDAAEKLLHDQVPILESDNPIAQAVRKIHRANGGESVTFDNGSRLFVLASTPEAGHGKVIDLGVIDESFSDIDDRREQALLPAMLPRRDGQILNISTAGTDKSPFLRRKVDAGRASVAAGETSSLCYFEWSAPDDADIDDPAVWRACMPALGQTINEAAVRHARRTQTEGDFRRAMLNQWTSSDERLIPAAAWDAVCRPDVKPEGTLVFAVDVDPDRTAASVAVADAEGRCELLKHEPGTGWVVPYLIDLSRKNDDADIILDANGPAGTLVDDLEAAPGTIYTYSGSEMSRAAAEFYDGVADRKISVRRHSHLDKALAAAVKRHTGDRWTFARSTAGDDVSPLIALTLAVSKADEIGGAIFFAFGQ